MIEKNFEIENFLRKAKIIKTANKKSSTKKEEENYLLLSESTSV